MSVSGSGDSGIGMGKTYAQVFGGAVSIVALYLLNRFIPPPPLPDYICGAIQTVVTGVIVFFVPHSFGSKSGGN